MKLAAGLVLIALSPMPTLAQEPVAQKVGLVRFLQASYAGTKRNLAAAAQKMPESDYGFRPSQLPETRTFAAVIGHAADGMFASCANAKGVPNPVASIEKTLTSKADIVKALADSIALCDGVFAALTDQNAGDYLPQGPVEVPRSAVLMGVIAHNGEMYGISTVYLRTKNLVPPASDPKP